MKSWMKVALGCLAVSIIAAFLFIAGFVAFGYWAKSKFAEATGGGPEVAAARKAANAVPFVRPPKGIVEESRLLRFIRIRTDVYAVYDKYRGEIESRSRRLKEATAPQLGDIASDVATGFTFIGELQRAEALALAKHQMSEDEYSFISSEVYKSMWTDLGSEGAVQAKVRASDAARSAAEGIRNLDVNGTPTDAPEALARTAKEAAAGADEMAKGLEKLQAPPENFALFKKYEADLKKYAMPGLNVLFNQDAQAPEGKK